MALDPWFLYAALKSTTCSLSKAWFLSCEETSFEVCLLNGFLIAHLQDLMLTGAFFLFLLSQTAARHSSLTDCLPLLSFQRPWVSSWPAVVPHPDTASSKSCRGCASTAVTPTCVTAPPPGIRAHSTVCAPCSGSCCWGCGCDMESFRRGAQQQWTMRETFHMRNSYTCSLSCSRLRPNERFHSVWC